jgi:chromosome segregation ATPase
MFHRFFTGSSLVIRSKLAEMQARLDVWEAFVPQNARAQQRIEKEIAELREEMADYKTALHKLRGQVHGPKAQIERLPARQVQFRTKDDLRRAAGIIAGQPAPHQQDEGDE